MTNCENCGAPLCAICGQYVEPRVAVIRELGGGQRKVHVDCIEDNSNE